MARGLTTSDGVDLNDVYNNVVTPIIDRYNSVDRTDFRALLCSDEDERVKNYFIPETDRMQLIRINYRKYLLK